MKRLQKNSERGIALLVALFALVLIAAIGLGMMFSSDSELTVNNSYRQNQLAYYAARSGLEEARDRMRFTSTDVTANANGISDFLPSVSIGQTTDGTHPNPGVLYIIKSGVDPTDVTSTYFDDELCHEISDITRIPNSPGTYNVKCPKNASSVPQIAGWSVTKPAVALSAGNGAISYAWSRISRKMQESTSPWCVLGYGTCTPQTGPDTLADQVCYDGSREFVLADAKKPIDVPGAVDGVRLPSELAMNMSMMFGANGQGNSGHSTTSTTGTSTTGANGTGASSTTGSTTGTSSSSSTSGSVSSSSSSSSAATVTTTTTGSVSSSSSTSGSGSSSSSGTSSASTGGGGSCSGVYTPPAKPSSYTAPACVSANGQPVYTLTTLALSPGGARRMLQYEIAQILIPPVPSALTLAGPSPVSTWPSSNPYKINGNDGCTTAGHVPMNLPAVGVTTDVPAGGTEADASTAETTVANNIASALPKPDNYTGVDGCTPDVQNVMQVAPSFNTVSGLNAIVQSVENSATSTFNTDMSWTGTDVANSTDSSVTVVNGNVTLTGSSHGYGILLVTGTLTMDGHYGWDGLILVIGQGAMIGNGGGSGQVNGAVVVANIGNSNYTTNPTDSNLLDHMGTPTFNMSGGGGNGLQYNSCLATKDPANVTFKVLAKREITY